MNQEVYLHFERMLIKEITHPYSVTQHNASQLIKIKLSMQQLYFHGVTGDSFTRSHLSDCLLVYLEWYILFGDTRLFYVYCYNLDSIHQS